MKTNLETALDLIAQDHPIPVDLHAALLDEGIDIESLENSSAADQQLTFFHLLDEQ